MKTFPYVAAILLAFCFITQARSQSSHSRNKSYSALSSITPTEKFFFFTLNDDEHGLELWRSDGTTEGTFLIRDIHPDQSSSSPSNFKLIGDKLFFTADDGVHGRELWCSDGSHEGTYLVADLSSGMQSSAINMVGVDGSELLFMIDDDSSEAAVWKSDGSFAGTVVADEILEVHEQEIRENLLDRSLKKHAKHLRLILSENEGDRGVNLRETTLFVARDARHGEELWAIQGHDVSLLKDIHTGMGDSFITGLTRIGEQVYFSAYDGVHGSELWKSDGTSEGTEMIIDIMPGSGSSLPRNFIEFNDQVYFSVVAESGIELWVTDGTREGTREIFPARSSDKTFVTMGTTPSDNLGVSATVNEEGPVSRVQVFPNPLINNFYVRVDAPWDDEVALGVTDMNNRTTYDTRDKTNADIQIEAPMTQGTYFVRIRTRKNQETVRVTKAD